MKRISKLILASVFICGCPVFAQESATQECERERIIDPYISVFSISPTQFYSVKNGGLFSAVLLGKANTKTTGEKVNVKKSITSDTDIQNFFFSGVSAPLKNRIQIGGTIEKQTLSTSVKITQGQQNAKTSEKSDATEFGPFAAIHLNSKLSLGVQLAFRSEQIDPKEGNGAFFSFMTFNPSLLYHNEYMEVVLFYTPTIRLIEEGGSIGEAGTVGVLSRFWLTNDISIGGSLTHNRESELSKETRKNSASFALLSEYQLEKEFFIGASIEHTTASAKSGLDKAPDTIASNQIILNEFYYLEKEIRLGVGFYYTFNAEETGTGIDDNTNEKIKITTSAAAWGIAMSVNYIF